MMSVDLKEPGKTKATTIYQVAEAAGVSIGTVSRVLRGEYKSKWASSARRAAEIRRVAEQLGYRPSWRGRAFASGKTHTIGLINQSYLPLHLSESWHEVMQGLIRQFRSAGYGVQFVPMGDEEEDLQACRQIIMERRFDGCVVFKYLRPEVGAALLEVNMPAVLVNAEADGPWPQIQLDDFNGAALLTNHLIELGHRAMAFVGDDAGDMRHFSLRQRVAGVRHAMNEAGLGELVEVHRPNVGMALDQLLALETPPTAIITYHDQTAVSLLQACWRRGLRVPEQISVGTFNDSKATHTTIPPLTTVRLPSAAVTRRAVSLLLELMTAGRGEEVAERVVFPEELVIRESTSRIATGS